MHAGQVIDHYAQRLEDARNLRDAWLQLQVRLDRALEAVGALEAEARGELAHAYLPRLDREALAALEQLTGYLALSRRDPLTAMAKEELVLKKTVARVASDERYRRREYLVGPHGQLTAKAAETREMLEPWEHAAARFEDLDGFLELVEVGYDTPAFSEQFWQPAYWRHWAAGDRICVELGLDDFGDDVLPAWREVVSKRDPWRAEVAKAEAVIAAVHDLAREHDEALERLPRLPAIYLEASVGLVGEFLATADYALLDEWARATRPDDRPIRMGLRRAAGLRAKLDILRELAEEGVGRMLTGLDQRMGKYQRKITKFRRPKYRYVQFTEDTLDRKFEAKAPRYHEKRDKLLRLVERLVRYDRYDRFDLANPPELWFVEMTGKRPPFQLPRTRAWYDERDTGTGPRHDDWDATGVASEVAATAAAQEPDDIGYLS